MTIPHDFFSRFTKTLEHLQEDLKHLKTNRAMPSLVEDILVNAYGTKTPLSQLASISSQGSQTLNIQPWDNGVTKEIEKAISESDLGINPIVESGMIRLNFPPLTEEKRKEIVKVLHEKLENSKVSLRKIREEYLKGLKEQEKNGDISEDEYFAASEELQKKIVELNNQVKEIGEKKEIEIMTV